MDWVSALILGVGLVLLIQNVNSSATCVEKFLDGQTAATKHEVIEGERVTLRCDVSNRDPSKDMVYWKFDDEVMSQDDTVIPKYKSKFNVTLENDVYTISWIAELDDAGKYNCTCTTGGIQYPVWIKRACNKRKHVINTTDASSKSKCITSPDVLKFLLTNTSYELEVDQSLNFNVALDCNCTWPEVNRTFTGVWYTEDTEDQCKEGEGVKVVLENATGEQDTSITPIGCYTGKGSVTYRYRNVFGCINSVFTCTMAMLGKKYSLYIDEGQSTRPAPIMEIRCTGLCEPTLPPTSPSPVCDESFDIGIIVIWSIAGILLVAAICAIKVNTQRDPKKQKYTKIIFVILIVLAIIVLLANVIMGILRTTQPCAAKDELLLPKDVVIAITVLAALAAVAVIIISGVYLCHKLASQGKKQGKKKEGYENHSFSDVTPLTERKKCQICSMNPVEFYLKPCGHLICSICCKSIQNESRQQGNNNRVANCPVCATVQATDIEKLCMICWKKPVQGYFKPCQHSAACLSCTQSKKSLQARCPECKEEVKDYQTGICLICLENPVKGLFKPCQHVAACTSCAESMFEKSSKAESPSPAHCPKCKKEVKDYEPDHRA